MYKEGQKFLENWCNDTKNDSYEKELKEYGEKEVENMLYEYRLKFSLFGVGKSFCGCTKPKPNYPEMVWCDDCTKEISES